MATSVQPKPVIHAPATAKASPTPARSGTSAATSDAFSLARQIGNQNYRTLAQSQSQPPASINQQAEAKPQTSAESRAKLPPLSPEMRDEMTRDIDEMVKILKSSILETADQIRLVDTVKKYARLDDIAAASASRATPNLDHFLSLLKQRSFARSSIWSLGQDQWALVYDALWYRLRNFWLEEFKRFVARSQTEKTSGAQSKDVENGVALIAKQEAMGLWGMLKGMGTGLVGIAGPKAAQEMAAQFDETGRILFDHEWDSSEPLVAGMNASQIGTLGGDVIWQLVTFARAAGAKGGKILEVVNNLEKFKKAQQALGVLGGIQGIALGAQGIARVIEDQQKAGIKITLKSLIDDPIFVDQLIVLLSSAVGTAMAARAPGTAAGQLVTRPRVQVLLGSLQITASMSRLADVAASDRSDDEKTREYGQVLAGLIPQMVSVLIDANAYRKVAQSSKASPHSTPTKKETAQDAVLQPIVDVESPAGGGDIAPVDLFSLPKTPPAKKTIGRRPGRTPLSASTGSAVSAAPPVRKTIGKSAATVEPTTTAASNTPTAPPIKKTIGKAQSDAPAPGAQTRAQTQDQAPAAATVQVPSPTSSAAQPSAPMRQSGSEVFDELASEMNINGSSASGTGVAGAAQDAQAAGLIGVQGTSGIVDTAVQAHGSASEIRGSYGVTGSQQQSAHVGPTSFLRTVPGYSRSQALTVLLDPATHRAFDASWKNWAIAQRQAGRTTCTVQELRTQMHQAITQIPNMSQRTRNTLAWRMEMELQELNLSPKTTLPLPYSNVGPTP